jgi:sugar phosphate isomerase/epimerase
MTITRRTFLGHLGAQAAAAGILRDMAFAKTIERLGVQLYTVRDLMAKDFEGTLAKVAGAGYKEVEFAGYFDRKPQDVRSILDRNGLAAPSTHVDYPSLSEDKLSKVIEVAHAIGHQFIVNPWIDEQLRKEPEIWKRIAATFNRAGEMTKKAGIQFAYHNHHFEFAPSDGKLPYELLLEQCDPKLVKMELDLCWISAAGKDPLDYFSKYPGRFPLVHVKGLSKKPDAGASAPIESVMPSLTEVGSNDMIDWKRIFARSEQAGIQHYFVEHDVPKDPYESLKASYSYLTKLDF